MNDKSLANHIYNRFGTITRTRNCFLYTKKGIRLTDLYQQNGRAILGWHGNSSYTYLKNFLCKGLTGSFITEDKSRLQKAVEQLLNSPRLITFFANKKDAIKACVQFSPENTNFYKPWNQNNIKWENVDCVIIPPPLPWTDSIFIAAINPSFIKNNDIIFNNDFLSLPNDISIPFALQSAITRSIYDLIKAIQERQEKDWFIYDQIITKYWERKGPYLYPKMEQSKYDEFVLHCLDCNLVINPSYNSPSIIPFGADKGVFTNLKNKEFLF